MQLYLTLHHMYSSAFRSVNSDFHPSNPPCMPEAIERGIYRRTLEADLTPFEIMQCRNWSSYLSAVAVMRIKNVESSLLAQILFLPETFLFDVRLLGLRKVPMTGFRASKRKFDNALVSISWGWFALARSYKCSNVALQALKIWLDLVPSVYLRGGFNL